MGPLGERPATPDEVDETRRADRLPWSGHARVIPYRRHVPVEVVFEVLESEPLMNRLKRERVRLCYHVGMAGMQQPAQRFTYQDVLDAPENQIAELLDGQLYTQARPAAPHAQVASVLGMDIGGPFHRGRGGPGGWLIIFEPELHLGENVLVPDLAGWRLETMATVPKTPRFTIPPDWVCEVLSHSTGLRDRRNKLPIYAQHCVQHVWLVNPQWQSVEVFALDGPSYRLLHTAGEDEVARLDPFAAVELELGALWPEAPETTSDG